MYSLNCREHGPYLAPTPDALCPYLVGGVMVTASTDPEVLVGEKFYWPCGNLTDKPAVAVK